MSNPQTCNDESIPETNQDVEAEEAGVSYATVLRTPNVRVLAVSRAMGKMAMATISYGAMVHLARLDASQIQISLVGAASYLAALLFGFQGGTAADSLSKRVAVAGGHGVLALICVLTPTLLGTTVGSLMLLMFLASLLMQIVSPGLKAATALVASPSELATTSALVSVVGSVASGIGSAFLAPILIKTTNIDVVLYAGGFIYAIGAVRALKIPIEEGRPTWETLREVEWKPRALGLGNTAELIVNNRAVATMIAAGAIVVAMLEAFNTLIPRYVGVVLDEDPANAVFIFAPAGLGLLIGTMAAPRLIRRWGERRLAVASVLIMSASMAALGLVDILAPFLAPFSPLRLLELAGVEISNNVLAASLISVPLNFGSTLSGATVMNYINRVVPLVRQGTTFGIQSVQVNLMTLVAVLVLGVVATLLGSRIVMIAAPVVTIGVTIWMIRYSYRRIDDTHMGRREAWNLLSADDLDSE